MAEKIHSIKDPRVVHARMLATSQGRLKSDEFLLEGIEHIKWGLEAQLSIQYIFIWEKYKEINDIQWFTQSAVPYFLVSEGILKKITNTNYLIPCVAVAQKKKIEKRNTPEITIILDNLVDHGNIGTIIRSAAAFGIKDIISTSSNADFFYKKIIDSSRGKVFEAHFNKFLNGRETIQYLKEHGYQIVATSPHAKTVQSLAVLNNKPVALVFGNESEGCSDLFIDEADLVVQIPMHSAVESLNVAVAAGISIYEIKIKLVIAMLIQKIHKTLGRQVGVTHTLIRQALDVELRNISFIDSWHFIFLMILKYDHFMSLDQVKWDVGLYNNVQAFLNPLIADDYIKSIVHDGVEGVVLTKLGEEFLAKLWPIIEKTEEKILHGFSDIEKTQLLEYITRMQDNCTKIINSSS